MSSTALGFAALLLLVGSVVLWFRALGAVRIPENRSGFVTVWLAAGALGVAALVAGGGWVGGVPAVLAIVGAAFFCFTVSISRQDVAADVIAVGATLPDFTAIDENGQVFEASSLAGRPVLIKFFRGHW